MIAGGIDVARGLAELDLREGDLAVLGDGRALGEGVADGEHLGGLRDRRADLLDLRLVAGVEHAAVVDLEDDGGGITGLGGELVLEQVVGPLGLGARQVEVVDVVTRGGGPESSHDDERCDPQADYEAAPVVAPGGKVAHKAKLKRAASRSRCG